MLNDFWSLPQYNNENWSANNAIQVAYYEFIKEQGFIEDREADAPIKTVASELLREDLAEILCTLSPRERDVLRLRFGMDDGRQRTLEEVGQLFGVTRERIRQIEAKALRKLRHPNRSKRLKEYVEN